MRSKTSRVDEFVGNPRRALWVLALPIMIGMSIQTIYMLVDMMFVGRVSARALAALAFNMPVVFLGIGVIFGLGSGVTAVIARYIGAEDKRGADSAAEHGVVLGLVLSSVFTGCAYIWGRQLLGILGVPDDLLPLAWDYFSVLAGGYIFLVMSVFFRSILSGEGDMKTPMLIQGSGTLLNIALDPLFIFTFQMGVRGAAWATVLSQMVAAAAFVYLLFFKEHAYVSFDRRNFRFDPGVLGRIFEIGLPASFSFLVIALGGAVFNRILVSYSQDAVAAFQVGARIDHIFLLPVIGISASLVTLVGMFTGARRQDLVRAILFYAMLRSILIAGIVGSLFFALAPQILGLFTSSAPIAEMGVSYLRINVLAYPFIAVIVLAGRAMQGMGKGAPALVLALLRVVLISAPLATVFAFVVHKPVHWIWWSIFIGMAVTAVIASVWLRVVLRNRLVDSEGLIPDPAAVG